MSAASQREQRQSLVHDARAQVKHVRRECWHVRRWTWPRSGEVL
jgi:hypothetical protein